MVTRPLYCHCLMGLILVILSGCTTYNPAETEYLNAIADERQTKDMNFRTGEHSPLKPDMKDDFKGLNYFPASADWRFEGKLVVNDSVVIDTILGTKVKDKRPAKRYGWFKFSKDGKDMSLLVYKMLRSKSGYEDYLFLGFTDKSSGTESYPAGRYIDLVKNDSDFYVVDFNKAYNPYCAYNDKFSCAIPPLENDLPIAVTAGEKVFK